MSEKLFTVESLPSEQRIEIHLNDVGLNYFIELLESMKGLKTSDHLHLFTNAFGGDELSNAKQNNENGAVLMNHLKIFLWKE